MSSHSKILIPQRQLQSKMGLFHATANHSILHISGCGWSWKTAQSSKSFSCASRIYRLFRFGAATRASRATTTIPRTSEIVPKLGGCRALVHISGCGWSWKTAQSSKSFSCASRIYWLFRFGPATRSSKATTAIPRTSNIVPKLGGCSAILHILGRGLSLEVARSSKLFSFASHIYWLLKFGAATRASEATTVIPCTSEIVPKLGGCRVIIHISGCDWSWKTA